MTTLFDYKGKLYPDYLQRGNAMQHILPSAQHFCQGKGLDIGAGKWPYPGALAIDMDSKFGAYDLPDEKYDYIFSSHCLEHIVDPVRALEHWKTRLRPDGGVLFLYLPHPEMEYWRPQNCRKHLHTFYPQDVAKTLADLGYANVIRSERDLEWSFAVVGFHLDLRRK